MRAFRVILLLLLPVPLVTCGRDMATSPLDVEGHGAVELAANNGVFAYVTNSNSGNVSVIATSTNTVAATVTVGDGPAGVAITPGTRPSPTSKRQCKNGGWEAFGFKNQGQCVRFVETGKDSRNGE